MSLFNSSGEAVLVLDIGSGSVGCGIVILSRTAPPVVAYTNRVLAVIDGKPDSSKLLSRIQSALRESLSRASKEAKKAISGRGIGKVGNRVFCTATSPWQLSRAKSVVVEKPEPFLVSKKYIADLAKSEGSSVQGVGEVFGRSVRADSLTVVEEKIVQTKLNGYVTSNPYDKKANKLEFQLFTSSVPNVLVREIEDSVHKYFPHRTVSFHTFPLVVATVLRDMFPTDESFLIADITAEVTDLTFVKDGTIVENMSFPVGRNTLVREVMDILKVNSEIALSYLSISAKGEADDILARQVNELVKKVCGKWRREFDLAASDFSKRFELPTRAFLTALPDTVMFFASCLESPVELNVENAAPSLKITVVNSEMVSHFCTTALSAVPDLFVSLESVFINRV